MIFHHHHSNEREMMYTYEDCAVPLRPTKKRRIVPRLCVRFNDKVIIHEGEKNENKKSTQPQAMSTWLTPNEFTKIRNNILTTLEFTKLQGESFGVDTPLSSRYCSRGLEDYDTEQKCTKFSTVQRRSKAIQVVLKEQEFQRQQLAYQLQIMLSQQNQYKLNRQEFIQRFQERIPLDHFKIGEIYADHTFLNVENAIDTGRIDSEDALAIYRSKPLPLAANIAPTNANR